MVLQLQYLYYLLVETAPLLGVEILVPNDQVVVLVLEEIEVAHDLNVLELVGQTLDLLGLTLLLDVPDLDLTLLVHEVQGVLVRHLDHIPVEIVVEVYLEKGLPHLEVVDRDPRRPLHVETLVPARHEGKTVRHHDPIEPEEECVLGLLHIELELGLLIRLVVPDVQRGLLNANRVLTVEQFVVQDILHARSLDYELSPVDLLLDHQFLALQIIHPNLLQEYLEVVFEIIRVTQNAYVALIQLHQLLDVDEVPLETTDLLQRFGEVLVAPQPDPLHLRVRGDDHVGVRKYALVLDVLFVLDGLDALVRLETPDLNGGEVTPGKDVLVVVKHTGVYLVVPLQDVLYRVLLRVEYLDGLVAAHGELGPLDGTEREYVPHRVYYPELVALIREDLPFTLMINIPSLFLMTKLPSPNWTIFLLLVFVVILLTISCLSMFHTWITPLFIPTISFLFWLF